MKVTGSPYASLVAVAKLEAFPDSMPLVLSAILVNLLIKLFNYASRQLLTGFGSCLRFKSAKTLPAPLAALEVCLMLLLGQGLSMQTAPPSVRLT